MKLSKNQYLYIERRLVSAGMAGRPEEFWGWYKNQDRVHLKEKLEKLTGAQASHIISQLAQENYAEAIKRWEAISAV